MRHLPVLSYDRPEYADRVMDTEPDNLVAYWPLWERSGTVADNLEDTVARDGAYTGVTFGQVGIGDGRQCPLFDGTNDFVDVDGARTAFNGEAGSLLVWAKVSGSGVWTDSTERYVVGFAVSGTNYVLIERTAANNTLAWTYMGSNTEETVTKSSVSTTDWMTLGLTWDDGANEIKAYYNGSQEGSTLTCPEWVGTPAENYCCVGAYSTVPENVWDGYLAHAALWSKALTAAQMSSLAEDPEKIIAMMMPPPIGRLEKWKRKTRSRWKKLKNRLRR